MPKIYSNDVKLIMRKKGFLKTLGIIFLMFFIVNAVFWGGIGISKLLTKNDFIWFRSDKISIDSINYYAIIFGEYQNEAESLECSIWTASSGGSAYVYNNQTYVVVGQIYDSIDDANIVIENFSKDLTYTPTLKQYKAKKFSFKIKDISESHKKDIKDSFELIRNSINSVLKISNKIDTNILSNISASSEINLIKSDVKIARNNIDAINSNYNDEYLRQISNYFVKVEDYLDICINKLLTSDNYSGVCKYCACEIFFEYYDLVENIVK